MTIAYQLYCSRNFPPLPDTLRMLAKAGYTHVEGFGGLFEDVEGLRRGLNSAGLEMSSAHMGLDLVEDDPDRALSIAKTLGLRAVFVPFLMPEDRPTDADGWRAFGQRLSKAGAPFRAAGLTFGWHNHDFEMVPLAGGARPLDLIAEAPEMTLELDIGWVVRAGLDPVDYIASQSDRIVAAHIKDIAPEGDCADEDGWADVGHGTLDWPAILTALRAANVDRFVIEHDNPSDDRRFAERSLTTLSAL